MFRGEINVLITALDKQDIVCTDKVWNSNLYPPTVVKSWSWTNSVAGRKMLEEPISYNNTTEGRLLKQ